MQRRENGAEGGEAYVIRTKRATVYDTFHSSIAVDHRPTMRSFPHWVTLQNN